MIFPSTGRTFYIEAMFVNDFISLGVIVAFTLHDDGADRLRQHIGLNYS